MKKDVKFIRLIRPASPFFVEATSETIAPILKAYGITPGHGWYYKTEEGQPVEIFMHKQGSRSGWMVHLIDVQLRNRINKKLYGKGGYKAYHKWQDD